MVILLTGCGAPGAPSIIGLLREHDVKIIGIDMNPECAGVHLVDKFYQTKALRHNVDIYTQIQFICNQENVDVVLPIVTKELRIWAKTKDWLKERCGTVVAVNDKDKLDFVNNKARLHQFLDSHGIPVAQYEVVNTWREYKKALRQFTDERIFVKPGVGNGSRGCRSLSQFIDISPKPDGQITYLDFDDYFRNNEQEYLMMEYLPGDEYTIDIFADHGECLYVVPRKRLVIRGGITYSGEVEQNQEIIDYCTKIINLTGLHGVVGIQVKADTDGKYKILEINPRLQGTTCLSSKASINFPYWLAMQALGHDVPRDEPIKWGLKMFRHYQEVYQEPDINNGNHTSSISSEGQAAHTC